MKNKNLYIAIAIVASPILFALVAFPDTFSLSWNQGRGGFLFALAFIVAELVGLKFGISKKRLLAVIPLSAIVIAYLVALDNGLQDYIRQVGESYEVPLIYSWIWLSKTVLYMIKLILIPINVKCFSYIVLPYNDLLLT